MNINTMLKTIYDANKEDVDVLPIGDVLIKLNSFNEQEEVIFSNGLYFDGTYDSYRGYYKDLAIGCDSKDNGYNTVGDIKKVLQRALEDGEMQGYKGGDYPIERSTNVWFAYYGSTGEMVIDIKKSEGKVIIIVKEDDY